MCGIGAVDIVHRDPEVAGVFAAVADTDDVRVPECRRPVGFEVESLSEAGVVSGAREKHLDGVIAWQAWVVDQVHRAHAAGAEQPHYRVAGKRVSRGE